jgi:pre-60S factor REI1
VSEVSANASLTSRKTFSSENAYRSHVQSRKHRERELVYANNPSHSTTENGTEYIQGIENIARPAADGEERPRTRLEDRRHSTASSQNSNDEDGLAVGGDDDEEEGEAEGEEEEEEEVDIESKLAASRRRRHLPSDCLFCPSRLPTIDTCLQHMSTLHSFFIPDRDYLSDISGLLAYLGEKVVVGNICLYCPGGNREFGSVEAVRRHMIDKSHCKMAFETDDDRIEVSDYYSYELEDGEGDEWEDVEDGVDVDGSGVAVHSHASLTAHTHTNVD